MGANCRSGLYRGGPSKNWLKTKNMVEGEFILLGTEIDDSGIPWALLAREQDGALEFAGPAILRPPSHARAEWAEKFATMAIDRPAPKGLRKANSAQWLKPEIQVRAQKEGKIWRKLHRHLDDQPTGTNSA